jgi:hypothetical protein
MASLITLRGIPLKNRLADNNTYEKNYTVLPEIFESKESWPSFCNLDCYHCTCTINRTPLFVPVCIDGDKIYRGTNPPVCSPGCGVVLCAGNSTLIEYLRELCFRLSGKKLSIMFPSSDKSVLKNFGGRFTKEQYQEQLMTNNEFFAEQNFKPAKQY